MNEFSSHIAIIGAGISGLTLGCSLKSMGVETIIFEKSSDISEYGAGISISSNGLIPLDQLGLIDEIKKNSFSPQKVIFKHNNKTFFELQASRLHFLNKIPAPFFSMSRQKLVKTLQEKYKSLGGKILFDHKLENINESEDRVSFSNAKSYKVKHIAACDGIKSVIRERYFSKSFEPQYSGYSAWRGIGKSNSKSVEFHLGKNSHIVSYPINDGGDTSFVGIVKTKNLEEESWKKEGTFEELLREFSSYDESIFSMLKTSSKPYKWGIYIRPPLKTLFTQKITLLGDAAHPMVPFLGQGGCMAIEDAYTLGLLCSHNGDDFPSIQKLYQKLRIGRTNKIQKMSYQQGKFNHLNNPLLVSLRNTLIKNTNIVANRLKYMHHYDTHIETLSVIEN